MYVTDPACRDPTNIPPEWAISKTYAAFGGDFITQLYQCGDGYTRVGTGHLKAICDTDGVTTLEQGDASCQQDADAGTDAGTGTGTAFTLVLLWPK